MMRWTATMGMLSFAMLVGCASPGPPTEPLPERGPLGFGSQSDEDRTGAGKGVDASSLGTQHFSSVQEILEGRVAGLEVVRLANGDLSLRIRGGSPSLLGRGENEAREPLLIIDGMPILPGTLAQALDGLNPFEVDRIEVLKDASSTAIYGSRGAHGVVLIALRRDL